MKFFAIVPILFFALAIHGAELETVDGRIEGRIESIAARSIEIHSGGKRRAVPFANIIRATLAPLSSYRSPVLVAFENGERFSARAITLTGTTIKGKSLHFEFTCATDKISYINFSDISESEIENARSPQQDFVFIATSTGKLDQIRGLVASIDDKAVKLDTNRGNFSIDRAKVKAIAFVRLPPGPVVNTPMIFTLRDGSRIYGLLDKAPKGISIVQGERRISLPVESIAKIENLAVGLKRLEDLEFKAERICSWPIFPLKPKCNKSLWGHPLSLGGVKYSRGISVQSGTELTFKINGEYSRFVALAGIDDEVKISGRAAISILANDKIVAEIKLKVGNKSRIDCALVKANILKIRIQDGGDGNLGDHVNILDCVLVKQ